MKWLASVRCSEAENVVGALREDPGYFTNSLRESFEHSPKLVKVQPSETISLLAPSDPTAHYTVFANAAEKFVRSKLADVERWNPVASHMERLFRLKVKYAHAIDLKVTLDTCLTHGSCVAEIIPEEVIITMKQADKHLGRMLREILDNSSCLCRTRL